ncbi:MAG: hypothetical protein PHH58_05365 [Rhodoferax sp.]|nr:hypothetical protein [Rhodoferax sp.]
MKNEMGVQRLIALFVLGWALINFPLLGLLDVDASWFGLPAFPAAIFLLWMVLIVATAWLVERCGDAAAGD